MTIYLKYRIKDILTDLELIGWSIGFIELWVFLWIFVFTSPPPSGEMRIEYLKVSTGLAYSFLGVLSLASAAVGLTYKIYFSSTSIRYITKFTRLSPGRYLLEDFLGSLVAILILVGVVFVSVIGLTYVRWGVAPLPKNSLGVIADLVIASVLFYWMSYTLALATVVARRPRAHRITSYIPLIIGFIAYLQFWINYGPAVYLIPSAPLIGILVYHSTGTYPPTGNYLGWLTGNKLYSALNLRLAATSTIIWIAIFVTISLILLKKVRGTPIEELY